MNPLLNNELLGTVAFQSALMNVPTQQLSLAKALLVLPLLFDRGIRTILRRKNSAILGSTDLIVSYPHAFTTVRTRYADLALTSLNAILLASEMGMIQLADNGIVLALPQFKNDGAKLIGDAASEIIQAGPKLGLILNEADTDLYQTFRIPL